MKRINKTKRILLQHYPQKINAKNSPLKNMPSSVWVWQWNDIMMAFSWCIAICHIVHINTWKNSFTNETTGYPLTKHKMMIMSSIVLILNMKWKNALSFQNANESVALNNHIISIKALHQMLVSLSMHIPKTRRFSAF